jgi:methylated-DNA-[protein]-cysteine S-methyltransferase
MIVSDDIVMRKNDLHKKPAVTQELSFFVFQTDAGWMSVLGSATGLRHITLPHKTEREVYERLGDRLDKAVLSPDRFEDLVGQFRAYISGHHVDFPDKLDFSRATSFQRAVWQAARGIPYGQTRSYGWLAGQIGKPEAARAVGQALGKNPLPIIIPCHRVLAGDGGLGGFTGGLEMKQYLLSLENASLIVK